MKQLDYSKLSTWKKLQLYLKQTASIWEAHTQFSNATIDLASAIADADNAIGVQSISITGVTADRNATQQITLDKVLPIVRAAEAYAIDNGNQTLYARVHISTSYFSQTKLLKKVPVLREILEASRVFEVQLAGYGVKPEDFTAASAAIDAMEAISIQPQVSIGARAKVTAKVGEIIRAGTAAVEKMDRLVIQFRESAPEFYSGFKINRVVHASTGRRYKGGEEKAV